MVCFSNSYTDIFHIVKQDGFIASTLFFYRSLVVVYSFRLYNFFSDNSKYNKNNY